MEYYHNQIVQKSWEELQTLKKHLKFVLIGGWAIWLYTQALKSKDIDIIVSFDQLATLGKLYQLHKNERLKKYEAVKESIQIDIYFPYFSTLGLPVEKLLINSQSFEGFQVLIPDYLFVLKLYTLAQRGRSPKGRKDFLDLISLLGKQAVDYPQVLQIIKSYRLQQTLKVFKQFLDESTQIEELNLNPHFFAKTKKRVLRDLELTV
ncbi:hypothetical protein A2160_04050 [Candidatus Beckwithbacteria bacterium RBG_13_42_9]|uniref:Uncharacterized protein n=1 Tax=Candidatus Beckwithbacteria bacterium RBG_13_42_9 TaxID=1797457 RepID=A0A1F5E3E0_9BACT|nr:MAG: hypothetical protein A2160_04050 [Candidatus Beckwithbacteria bacterium RBG_13_42_9]